MIPRVLQLLLIGWLAVGSVVMTGRFVSAQEGDSADERPLRERTIYVPYQRLRSLFEKEGRGVFLPYEEFQQLWQAAREGRGEVAPEPDRQRSVITAIDSVATVEGTVVSVESTVRLELLASGWHEIPLQLMGSALSQATIDDRPARVFQREDGQQVLLLRNPDDAPLGIELKLVYAQIYEKTPGTNHVVLHPPLAPIHRWEIVVPEADAQVRIQPNVALKTLAAETEGNDAPTDNVGEAMEGDENGALTRVEAYVGGADTVGFSWTAKAEGAAGLTALVTAQARQEVTVDEGVIRTRATLTYDVSRADVSRFVIEVPADHD
ncbi:MAG: hypothetical protein KDA83_17035, partial [Planctomycetales bacterium]|nr:hypothetical protein [Planctomycetales bacterium]